MRSPEEGGPSLEILFADPGVGRLEVLGLREIDEDHQGEERTHLFLHGLIVPSDSQDLLVLRENEISKVVNREDESLSARVVEGFGSIADVGWMECGECFPEVDLRIFFGNPFSHPFRVLSNPDNHNRKTALFQLTLGHRAISQRGSGSAY